MSQFRAKLSHRPKSVSPELSVPRRSRLLRRIRKVGIERIMLPKFTEKTVLHPKANLESQRGGLASVTEVL